MHGHFATAEERATYTNREKVARGVGPQNCCPGKRSGAPPQSPPGRHFRFPVYRSYSQIARFGGCNRRVWLENKGHSAPRIPPSADRHSNLAVCNTTPRRWRLSGTLSPGASIRVRHTLSRSYTSLLESV